MIRKSILIVLPLVLAACGQSETAPEPVETAAPAKVEPGDVKVVVDANGLGAKGTDLFRFGAPRREVDATVEKAFGSMPEKSSNEECGAGPMDFSQFGPLQIAYMDGEFRGWFLREGAGVATTDGVRPGVTTLESLKLERPVRQLDTALDGEFEYTTADYGTITGFAEDGTAVTALQAGLSCFFR
ncbi:hypothetical protein [Qipengyuania qiaonensis]|uniref:Aspartate-semialdehyde dehydrogenase n=1 Tax=Qipengyuania qiaonensis TaxID=2867240 RepID=A0ABS7J418_9SPHN|nr:hypothetical protein [Qipengyuania qiaonensis]MBX7481036.1 hypothetical protein [Qipengyuania qiaonensis]